MFHKCCKKSEPDELDMTEYKEIFHECFDSINPDVWNFEVGRGPNNDGFGNWEEQVYTDSGNNAFCKDNVLNLKIIKEPMEHKGETFNYSSARINTYGKFNFTYGLVKAKVKVELADGPFPAIWCLSEQFKDPAINWPLCGEIDIFEYNTKWKKLVTRENYTPATLHFKARHAGNSLSYHNVIDDLTQWHEYAMEWVPEFVRFFHDGKEIGRYNKPEHANHENWPFTADNKFYLIINNAMRPFWGSKPNEDFESHTTFVDSITVYQKESYE